MRRSLPCGYAVASSIETNEADDVNMSGIIQIIIEEMNCGKIGTTLRGAVTLFTKLRCFLVSLSACP